MNTSTEAIRLLDEARGATAQAVEVINNLIADHDYQDVASLVASAAAALLEAATKLMQSDDVGAFNAIDRADDYLNAVFDIVDADTGDEG